MGKWHLTRDSAMHGAAPRGSWPLQRGFERYYGVLEGWTNLHHPHALVRDNSPVDVDQYPDGYYFTDDITDQAIRYLKELRAHDATRPFFLYLAHGAVHGPLHAKASDLARHRGRYDAGWDAVRAERFARQLELGLFPPRTPLPPRNHEAGHEVQAWSEHTDEEQARFARYMEVYAAMVDNVDQNLAPPARHHRGAGRPRRHGRDLHVRQRGHRGGWRDRLPQLLQAVRRVRRR